jgi:hypothetical protein
VAAGTNPVLAALIGFDVAYYNRLSGLDSVASLG